MSDRKRRYNDTWKKSHFSCLKTSWQQIKRGPLSSSRNASQVDCSSDFYTFCHSCLDYYWLRVVDDSRVERSQGKMTVSLDLDKRRDCDVKIRWWDGQVKTRQQRQVSWQTREGVFSVSIGSFRFAKNVSIKPIHVSVNLRVLFSSKSQTNKEQWRTTW